MENLIQPLIKAFGWSILNSLWQSALIYGILFIFLFSLPKLAAKYKHNLAFGSIVLMFICFGYNLSHQILLNKPAQTAAINIYDVQAYQYFNELPQSLSNKAEQYFPLVAAFYIIGIILQLFIIIKGYGKLSKLKKENLSNIPGAWEHIFDRVSKTLKINKKIKFHLSALINVPLVIGYLKPVVLFPLALVNQLDNEQVEAILIHELSHIRRNDFLLNLIKTAIETLLFFNPFVWMAGRFIHIEREHACDDLVLKVTGKPLQYAHALLKLELLKDKSSPSYALAATGKTQNLYQRIKRITNMKTNYLNAKQQMAALTLGVACLFSIARINPAEKKKQSQKLVKQTELSTLTDSKHSQPIIYTDTTKKRKIKIIAIDADGKSTEYNSLKEVPDNLKKDLFKGNMTFVDSSDFKFKIDTMTFSKVFRFAKKDSLKFNNTFKYLKTDTARRTAMLKYLNSADRKKQQREMVKKFNSPEWRKQMRSLNADLSEKINSAAFRAQIDSIKIKWNSPEFRNQIDSLKKKTMSPEWNKQMQELNVEALRKIDSKEFRAQIDAARKQGLKINNDAKLIDFKLRTREIRELRSSTEYKELKRKFDRDVKELKERKEREEQAEKTERLEKSN